MPSRYIVETMLCLDAELGHKQLLVPVIPVMRSSQYILDGILYSVSSNCMRDIVVILCWVSCASSSPQRVVLATHCKAVHCTLHWWPLLQEAPPDDAVSIAGNESVSGSELAKEQARQANEMADVKKKFMSVARRKQQEYARKVLLNPTDVSCIVCQM